MAVRRIVPIVFAAAAVLCGQSFEVASVKPLPKGADGGPLIRDPIHFSAGSTLLFFISLAYNVGTDQVSGPDWLGSEMYSVNANIPPGATDEQTLLMLRHLLAERFRMKTHMETRVAEGYNLILAKGGPKLKPAAANDGRRWGGSFGPDGAVLEYPGASIPDLIRDLTVFRLRKPGDSTPMRVVDKTGLSGSYDITLHYLPPGADTPGPDIFAALESQLGLRLEPAKISLDMVVVDHAEKIPLEN
jgi:uncharacterized protein (TIGR03435 family)